MRHRITISAVLIVSLMTVETASAGPILYGVDDATDQLIEINPRTGAATVVGSLGTSGLFIGLESASDGTLYVVNSTTDELFRIDRLTGTATSVGSFGAGYVGMQDLAFNSSGVLYGFEDATNDLVTIDLNTGLATQVVRLNNTNLVGLAFDSSDRLFTTDPYDRKLFEVNPTTGVLTEIGSFDPLPVPDLTTLDFGRSGTLYAAGLVTDALYTIDIGTGAATAVGNIGFGAVRGIAFDATAVPEPSSVMLMLLATMSTLGVRRFRSSKRSK